MQYRTGNEGKKGDERRVVICPAAGGAQVSTAFCSSCNYFDKFEKLDRGKKQPPKEVVICHAPLARPVTTVVLDEGLIVTPDKTISGPRGWFRPRGDKG